MKLSADIGHGHLKFFDGQKRVFEDAVLGEVQTALMENGNRKQIKTDEGSWSVGATAMTQSMAKIRGQDETWAFSPEYRAFLLYGISEFVSNNTDQVVVDLITGLPIVDYKRNRKQIKQSLIRSHNVIRPGKRNLLATIRDVIFLPQGFAPARAFMQPGKKIATLDIGSRNVNYTTFVLHANGSNELIDSQTDSREAGAMSILLDISKKIEEQTKRKLHQYQVIDALKTKTVKAFGQPYNVAEIIDYYLDIYHKSIKTIVSEVWGNTADIDHLLVFGGGALLVGDRLLSDYPQAVILDNPQWANAFAQFEYAKRRFQ